MVRNFLLAISVIAVAPAFAQTPRTVNPAPLERPEPLCNLRMTEIRMALEVVRRRLPFRGTCGEVRRDG